MENTGKEKTSTSEQKSSTSEQKSSTSERIERVIKCTNCDNNTFYLKEHFILCENCKQEFIFQSIPDTQVKITVKLYNYNKLQSFLHPLHKVMNKIRRFSKKHRISSDLYEMLSTISWIGFFLFLPIYFLIPSFLEIQNGIYNFIMQASLHLIFTAVIIEKIVFYKINKDKKNER